MSALTEIIKSLLIPGSGAFLWTGLAVGVVLLYLGARAQRLSRAWLTALTLSYVVLSVPVVCDALVDRLSGGYISLRSASDVPGVNVVVVFGNGIQIRRANEQALDALNMPGAFNALEAARVYRLLGDPLMIVSGGRRSSDIPVAESEVMGSALVQLGVPRKRIVLESRSATTHEQVERVGAILRARGVDFFVLVTAPEHMWRAAASFARAGFHPIPSPSRLRYGGMPLSKQWPNLFALEGSKSAIYEFLAVAYYRLRSWM